MATRITYTSGASDPELDTRFEQALEQARSGSSEPLRHVVAGSERDEGPVFERRNPSHVDELADEYAAATTGAWPGIQSFPGWKSSGSTGKGGLGPYYVQGFMREQSQTVAD